VKESDGPNSAALQENCPGPVQVTVKVATPEVSVGPGLGDVTVQAGSTVKVISGPEAAKSFATVTVVDSPFSVCVDYTFSGL